MVSACVRAHAHRDYGHDHDHADGGDHDFHDDDPVHDEHGRVNQKES